MIAADVGLREDLAICHHYRIPHSAFLSWNDDDQDKARAFWRFDRSVCTGCGTRPDEWDPAAGGDRRAYSADVIVCPGCQLRGDLQRDLQQQDTEQAGQAIVLLPRVEVERREAELAARRAARAAAL